MKLFANIVGKGGVLRGLEVECLTYNPGVLDSSCTGSSEFFVRVSLGKTLQGPSLVLVKPRKDMNNANCHLDMTEILLKAAQNTIQPICEKKKMLFTMFFFSSQSFSAFSQHKKVFNFDKFKMFFF